MLRALYAAMALVVFLGGCNSPALNAKATMYYSRPLEGRTPATSLPGGHWLQIVNQDSEPWEDVVITLNKEYTFKVSAVHPQPSIQLGIKWSDFVKEDGTRFDFSKLKPQSITITAKIGGKKGKWTGPLTDGGSL